MMKKISYIKNESLPVIKKDYKGNRVEQGKFLNDFGTHKLPFRYILKWKFSTNPQKKEKETDPFRVKTLINSSFLNCKDDLIVWLGQCSFYIQINGVKILTDPCLTDLPMRKRLAGLPCGIEEIKNIDYLLISHNHMDHLDKKSMRKIDFTGAEALVPLRMGKTINAMNSGIRIQEGGWYQQYSTVDKVSIFLLPAHHWSRRSLMDANKVLWGSFMIKGGGKTVYFAGDTSYSYHFSEIAALFPDIDVCLMPIGAYKPDYVMSQSHLTPNDAVTAFNVLKGKEFIPMHYATYDLSNEPPGEPVRLLHELISERKIKGKVSILDIGYVFNLLVL